MKTRTRFAPSPTGFMHIGGVRTALYAYLIARQNNGSFILRIEDTDQERFVEGATEVIYSTLKDLGLNWDEGPDIGGNYGPYIQSERKANYLTYAKKLIEEEKAYYCLCSEERLTIMKSRAEKEGIPYKYDKHCLNLSESEEKELLEIIENNKPHVIRFKMPKEGKTVFEDIVYGKIEVENKELEDLIMIKSDGMPTYNFANIIDDHEMEITHVIRGNEYVSSTPKYVLMYQALNFPIPEFIHLPIIKETVDSDKKLSKRNQAATVDSLKTRGYLNSAIINTLALTGWCPKENREIFSLEELINVFDVNGIGKGNAIFDIDKLNWFNNYYLKQMDKEAFVSFVKPFLASAYDLSNHDDEWINKLISIYQEQISYGLEIINFTSLFFNKEIIIDKDCSEFLNSDESIANTLSIFKTEIESIKEWNVESITNAINNTKEKSNANGKLLFMPIRIKISGQMHGPELPETIFLLGKELVLDRLN